MVVFAFLAYFIQISATPARLTLRQMAVHCGIMLACVFIMRILFGLYASKALMQNAARFALMKKRGFPAP